MGTRLNKLCAKTCAWVLKTINNLGGVDENGVVPRRIELPDERGLHQRSLFDDV